jgi:D-sedoheptulose 7-phosphate isomerase
VQVNQAADFYRQPDNNSAATVEPMIVSRLVRGKIRDTAHMSSDPTVLVKSIFDGTIAAHERFAGRGLPSVLAAAEAMARALASGGKVLAFGNGGSAADAQHLVAELVGRFELERRGLPAVALTADSSIVTAIANDYGYATVFTRQVEALGAPGDVAFGISTSGRSANVEAALAAAKARGLVTIALTGRDGGTMGAAADIHVNVPEQSTARIQEVHRTIMHAVCALIDRDCSGAAS